MNTIEQRIRAIAKKQYLAAFRGIVQNGVPENRRSKKFCARIESVHVPPKYLISSAYSRLYGEDLDAEEFSGGVAASNKYLSDAGIEVVSCTCGGMLAPHAVPVSPEKHSNALSPVIAFFAPHYGGKPDTNAYWLGQISKEADRVSRLGASLLILPEAALDAFGSFNPSKDEDDQKLLEIARRTKLTIIVGRQLRDTLDDVKYIQRADLIDARLPSPNAISYYKHGDPGYPSWFQSAFDLPKLGNSFPVANIGGLRIGMLICHDCTYPALAQQYAGRIDLLVVLSGASVNEVKWLSLIAERAAQVGAPAVHICGKDAERHAPGSCCVIMPDGSFVPIAGKPIYEFELGTGRCIANLSSAALNYAAVFELKHTFKGATPALTRVDLRAKNRVKRFSADLLRSPCQFQLMVLNSAPAVFLCEEAVAIEHRQVRALAIENGVVIAIRQGQSYVVINGTRYKQASIYETDRFAYLDIVRQAGTSILHRIPAEPYERLLTKAVASEQLPR